MQKISRPLQSLSERLLPWYGCCFTRLNHLYDRQGMIFDDDYGWLKLPQPGETILGEITVEEIYAALTKGAEAPPFRHFMTQFESEVGSLVYSFRDFSSDIYHEELISCSQRNPVGPEGKRSSTFRWGLGGEFRTGAKAAGFNREVMLEGRWTKNHDGMTSRFESGPDLRSTVHLHGVKLKLSVDEATMVAELRHFLTSDLKRVEPPPSPPRKPLDTEELRRLLEGGT